MTIQLSLQISPHGCHIISIVIFYKLGEKLCFINGTLLMVRARELLGVK